MHEYSFLHISLRHQSRVGHSLSHKHLWNLFISIHYISYIVWTLVIYKGVCHSNFSSRTRTHLLSLQEEKKIILLYPSSLDSSRKSFFIQNTILHTLTFFSIHNHLEHSISPIFLLFLSPMPQNHTFIPPKADMSSNDDDIESHYDAEIDEGEWAMLNYINGARLTEPILPLPSIPREKPLPIPLSIMEKIRAGDVKGVSLHERKCTDYVKLLL